MGDRIERGHPTPIEDFSAVPSRSDVAARAASASMSGGRMLGELARTAARGAPRVLPRDGSYPASRDAEAGEDANATGGVARRPIPAGILAAPARPRGARSASLEPASASNEAASSRTGVDMSPFGAARRGVAAQGDLVVRPSGLWVPRKYEAQPDLRASDAGGTTVHPAVQAMLDRYMPGKSFKKVLLVHAHPDDETIYTKAIETMLKLGIEVHLVCITSSNGGTVFTSRTGVQRPTMAATGKEDLDAARFGELRVAQTVDFLSRLGPNPSLVTIDVLSYPDRSPYNTPAERSIRYEDIADWNSESIVEFLTGVLTDGEYAAAFGLRNEEAVHGAHKRSTAKLEEAISRFVERTGRPAPIHGAAVEVGYYDPRVLGPIDSARKVEIKLTAKEVEQRREQLQQSFGNAQPHREVEFGEQPPGNQPQWNAERNYELIEVAPGTDAGAVQFLNALFNTRLPDEPRHRRPVSMHGNETGKSRPTVRIHRPDIPGHASSEGRLAIGVPQPPATPQTAHVGPGDDTLESLPARVRGARYGTGPLQPFETSDHDAEGMAAFRAGPRFVSDHVSLKTRFGALTPKQRREGHRVVGGPRRDTVRYAVSPSQMPHQTIGPNGEDLRLDSSTRVFTTIESAKEYAIELLRRDPDADVSMFRLVAPAKEMRARMRKNAIPSELIERVAMIADVQGNLYHETVANPSAKYRVAPGELYGPPPVTGMPVRYKRVAAATSLGKITGAAVASYLSVRHGLNLSHDETISMMADTGRAMFGARAWVNAQKAVMEIRLARLVDIVGAERGTRLEPAQPLASSASLAGERTGEREMPRAATPALDKLQRRTGGLRGLLRGFTRDDRAEIQLLADTLRAFPEDVDAFQRLNELVGSRMFSPNSVIERARRIFWNLSYPPNLVAGADLLLEPQLLAIDPFGSWQAASTLTAEVATLAFLPVHVLGNGGSQLENALRKEAAKRNWDPTVPADGERLRNFQPGNDGQSKLRRLLRGRDLTHPLIRPDSGRAFKLPLDRRLTEFQMLGASVGAVPFAFANVLAAAGAAASGDVVSALSYSGMVAADGTFAWGFRGAYKDAYASNHGLGNRVHRDARLEPISEPARGAESKPSDITQPLLVKGVNPQIVVAAGMIPQVVLQALEAP